MTRLCFVCLGNICRSPTAAAVMRHLVAGAGQDDLIAIDSAGTGSWHVGDPADRRARAEANRRGIAMDHSARQFQRADFDRFDLVLAMDHDNLSALRRMTDRPEHHSKVRLLRDFDPTAGEGAEVPDPYYGGPEGFVEVFDMVTRACRGLLDHVT